MEDTQTADTGTAEAQSQEAQQTQAPEQAQAPEASPSKESRLPDILKKAENHMTPLSDEELDIYEEHLAGKLKPEEVQKDKGQEKPQPDAAQPIADAMKELGAKTESEIPEKIRELRKQLTGKDAQAVAQLRKDNDTLMQRVRNEVALFEEVRKGNPEAIAHLEKSYGIKLAQPAPAGAEAKTDGSQPFLVPKGKFIEESEADLVNSVFTQYHQKIESLEKQLSEFKGVADEFRTERQKTREDLALQEARIQAVDEIVSIGSKMKELKDVPNLRQAVEDWYLRGKDDTRLEVVQKLFDIAKENKCNLSLAWAKLRADESDMEILRAREDGRKEAYNQKPTVGLSDMQGKGADSYQRYTDAQLKEMSEDYSKIPEDWFDADDRPDPKKIPKRAHKYFWPEGAEG